MALCAGLAFAVVAAVLVPWHWLPGGHVVAAPVHSVFRPAEIAEAESYSAAQWSLTWWELGLSLALGALLGLTPLGARAVRRLPGPWWVQVPLGALLVLLAGRTVTLPFEARAHQVDVDREMSTQSWSGWLHDQDVSLLVAWATTAIALLVLVAIIRHFPRRWPVVAAPAAAGLALVGSFVWPLAVEPLFNHFTTMGSGPLRSQIIGLAEREGVHVDDVLVADASRRTTMLNAYVSGFGSTRRVVVYDNLLTGLPRRQVMVVVAHELGHAKNRDVLTGTVLGALGSAFGVGVLGLVLTSRRVRRRAGLDEPGEAGVVPLLLVLMTVGSLLASPVQNTISRAIEARADRASLAATHDPAAFIAMQRQLALRALADPTPPAWRQFWFGSHPTTLQRIGMAKVFVRQVR